MALSFPGGPDLASAADRPETLRIAMDMHRHYNWDFVLTCPNIAGVRNEIREPAETAIRHVNMAILGIKGFYKTVLHTSDNSGTSPAHALQVKAFRKIRASTFRLYDSTVTGAVRDTSAGSSILGDPKLLLLLALVSISAYYSFSHMHKSTVFGGSNNKGSASASAPSSANLVSGAVSTSKDAAQGSGVDRGNAGIQSDSANDPDYFTLRTGPFKGSRLVINGHQIIRSDGRVSMRYSFVLSHAGDYLDIDLDDYPSLFSSIKPVNDCLAFVSYDGHTYQAYCDPAYDRWAQAQMAPQDDKSILARAAKG